MGSARTAVALGMVGAVAGALVTGALAGKVIPLSFQVPTGIEGLALGAVCGAIVGAGIGLLVRRGLIVGGTLVGALIGTLVAGSYAGIAIDYALAFPQGWRSLALGGGLVAVIGMLIGLITAWNSTSGPYLIRFFRADRAAVQRLQGDLDVLQLQTGKAETKQAEEPKASEAPARSATAVTGYLKNAGEALDRGLVLVGYQNLYAAERELVKALDADQQEARLASLREESKDKLKDSWRGQAVKGLLGRKGDTIATAAIQEALLHLHSHFQNTYLRIYLLKRQVYILGLVLAVVVLTTILLAQGGYLSKFDPSAETRVSLVVLFGSLGGALSAILSARHTARGIRIPDVHRSWISALVRPLIGGAAGIAIYVLIQSELIQVQIVGNPEATVLAFAFFAGFSERWFLRNVESPSTSASNGGTPGNNGANGTDGNSKPTPGSPPTAGSKPTPGSQPTPGLHKVEQEKVPDSSGAVRG